MFSKLSGLITLKCLFLRIKLMELLFKHWQENLNILLVIEMLEINAVDNSNSPALRFSITAIILEYFPLCT